MALSSKTRRRIMGAIFLVGALAMLVFGLTVAEHRLRPLALLIYWLICLVLTCGAMVVALRDLRTIRSETADRQRDLLKDIVSEIEEDAEKKQSRGK